MKVSGGAASLLLLRPPVLSVANDSQTREGMAMLVDVTKCISCWSCYFACKTYNKLTDNIRPDLAQPPALSPNVWTTLHPVKKGTNWISRKKACNHCTDAACVSVCPTGALSYNQLGFVQYNKEKCSGCGYCSEFCPFSVPQLDGNIITGKAVMNKCTFCIDRVAKGEPTSCAAACPTKAIKFGKRSDLLKESIERVAELTKTNTKAVLYGDKELGGLHVMYVLDDSPEVYGLPVNPEVPAPAVLRDMLRWVGIGATIAVIAGFGLNYLVARRAKMISESSREQ